jgi:hypothetical protein
VKRAAKKASIAERTLSRAKKRLGVKSTKGGFKDPWCWVLPTKPAATEPGGTAGPKAAKDAEGCHDSKPENLGSLRGSWQPSDGNGAPEVVRCAACGGVGWDPDDRGTGERCAACGAWSPCSGGAEDIP